MMAAKSAAKQAAALLPLAADGNAPKRGPVPGGELFAAGILPIALNAY